MASRPMRKVAYEPFIKIFIDHKVVFETRYMNTFYAFRMPIVKSAGFTLLTMPIPPEIYGKILAVLQAGGFPQVVLKFRLADMYNRDYSTKHSYEELPPGVDYAGNIVHSVPRSNYSSLTKVVPVSFYVINTIIHDMSQGNSYNKIFYNATAMGALGAYEQDMKKRYNDKINYIKITRDVIKYKYDNILVKSANNVSVPQMISTTYKVTNSLAYYYFDDFDTIQGYPVIGLYIDYTSPSGEIWKIFEDDDKFDITRTLRFKGQVPLGDIGDILRQALGATSIYMVDKDSITYTKKVRIDIPVPTLITAPYQAYIEPYKTRKFTVDYIPPPHFTATPHETNQHMKLYTPDTFRDALTRYNRLKRFLATVDAIYKFEIYECHIDAIQFYRVYTFDQTDLQSLYKPITITNIFSRIDPHQTPVNHTVQLQCLKYPS